MQKLSTQKQPSTVECKMKRCQFCLKERPAHSFYRVAKGKNYKHVYTCWKCRPYYLKGCTFDKEKRVWRRPIKAVRKPKKVRCVVPVFTRKEKENLKVGNSHYLSESIMVDYLD